MTLPMPSPAAQQSSANLQTLLAEEIKKYGNWIPFSRFMELVLYAPQYGYYTGGSHKIGNDGDFITAPTLTPLFARTLARQLQELLPQTAGNIYEFGAGTGQLAADLLNNLSNSINRYYIIEISPELAARQKDLIQTLAPQAAQKIVHLSALPETFDGIIIGNEVLDAMPVEIIRKDEGGSFEHVGVCLENDRFTYSARPLHDLQLSALASLYFPKISPPYTSELHPQQYAFIRTLASRLEHGCMIFIDYGFDAAQYYHPQRNQGTLIGHYRHHVIHNPFDFIGLADLTAHVNFTDIAQAGTDAGLDLIGYLPQSHFLLNLGITELLAQTGQPDSAAYIREAAAVQKLIDQHEMGELFKVIAFGKNINIDWTGFCFGDICHKL
ncbi:MULTISPECIES: class I SAM-dependent methyltransferase [Neisseria]|uniref:Class I SAM-dependent methyltransferase n=1 Tax=Neisseria cinerea TaxID=483 RepID=A0A7T3EUS7_NEICI|nr:MULTISPECIES: class I SAM-dependent methyltransferase [Neisseria]MBD0764480.1 S-adenosyl-L-methionine-dependent methyltransferase [Neisseria sp. RH3002v2f]QPT38369.1 class I SAM-dependent methyltransferase [Neisseria cinerea]SQF83812.1 Phospholipid N-methyltransferase [Neisseria cinerea]